MTTRITIIVERAKARPRVVLFGDVYRLEARQEELRVGIGERFADGGCGLAKLEGTKCDQFQVCDLTKEPSEADVLRGIDMVFPFSKLLRDDLDGSIDLGSWYPLQ
jgi:hypothetical protein